jgi:hypothetical protein
MTLPKNIEALEARCFQELGTGIGKRVVQAFSFLNIATNTGTQVKTGAGVLRSITVNTTAAGAITIYDNTSAAGTKIGTMKASIVEGTYVYDAKFSTGLHIVTAAASDITVTYE